MPVHGGRSVDDVCAGALERGGPRRGGVEPSSEAVLVEGALSPRVRRIPPEGRSTLERGGPHPRGRVALERGGPYSRGVLLCRPGGSRGPPGQ
jgi:hypothetical protein